MITLHKLTKDDIKTTLLDTFDRYQETTQVYYMNDGELAIKDLFFIESWDVPKRRKIANYLQECLAQNGVVLVLKKEDEVVAFGNLERPLYEGVYIHLPYIHVSRDFRHQGLGKRLFDALCEEAIQLGGTKLYISTHPSVESQRFYRSVGCVLANIIIPHIYEHEPSDIQLEKSLDV